MEGIVKKYFTNRGYGFISPYPDSEEANDYYFRIEDVEDDTKIKPHVLLDFDIINEEKGPRAINITSPSHNEACWASDLGEWDYDKEMYVNNIDTSNINYYQTLREQQQYPQFRKDIARSIGGYLSTKKVPEDKITMFAKEISNVILASLDLGNSVIKEKGRTQVGIIKELSEVYKVSIVSILNYLNKHNLIALEQNKSCIQFYEEYCAEMTTAEKIQFRILENNHDLVKEGMKGAIFLGGIGIVGNIVIKASKIWSPSYQKTQQMSIKHGK